MVSLTAVKPNDPTQAKRYFEDKMAFTTGPVELSRLIQQSKDVVVIDVREPEDYAKGHIPGAINLPKEKWHTLQGLNKNKLNVLYCYSQVCHLAATAAVKFATEGYPIMELEGGWDEWTEHNLPQES